MVVVIPPPTKIYLVLPWGVGNPEEIKHVFHVLQINHESTTLQQMECFYKLNTHTHT
jgi:hypothetical protein